MFVDLVYSSRLDVVPLNGAQQDGGIPVYPTSFLFSLMVTSNWDIVDGKNQAKQLTWRISNLCYCCYGLINTDN